MQKDIAAVKAARTELEREVSNVSEAKTAVDVSKARAACERIIVIDSEEGLDVHDRTEKARGTN